MKWFVFFFALASVVPLGSFLESRPQWQRAVWFLVGFLPFFGLDSVDINIISFEHYRGDARGVEITAVDLLVAAMSFALPSRNYPAPMRWLTLAYLAVLTLSMTSATEPLFALFSVWKMLRMILLLRVVSRGCEAPDAPPALLGGMGFGVLYELMLALKQRYLEHIHQVAGNFPHQNTLGMAVNLVMPLAFALVLSGAGRKLTPMTFAAGAVCIVLTLSRGAMMMMGLGLFVVYVVSFARRPSGRKAVVGLGALGGAISVVAYAFHTIVDRFVNAPKESAESRVQFENAAALMLSDHPFGVGVNQYSLSLEQSGYAARAGITGYDTSGIVHNIYWLTAAEVGYLGTALFVAILGAPVLAALRGLLAARRDPRGDVLLGIAVGLVLMYIQGRLEWAMRQTTLSYLFWTLCGIVHPLATTLRSRVRLVAG